jgi:predicted dehydrogenase
MRFLIAGLGSIGRRHLRNLVSLGQTDIILLRSQANYPPDDELKAFPVVTDMDAALQCKPDAVIVSNPTALHLKVAIPAAKAGCHLLLEKPISHSMQGIDELQSAVKSGGGSALVGFQFRFHPSLNKIKEVLSKGQIGHVLSCRSHWGEYLPGWHPQEDYRKGYSARQDLGGGVVLSLCHPLDYLHWLFGQVAELAAITGKLSDLEIEVEDTAEIILNFHTKTIGSLHLDYVQQPPSHTLEVLGTDGCIRWNYSDGIFNLYQNDSKEWKQYPLRDGFSRNDLFLEEMRHFIACVEGSQQPVCTLEDGIYAQRLIEAVYHSSLQRCMVKITRDGRNG